MTKKWQSERKDNFLRSIKTASIEEPDDELSKKCKFNFSYFSHGKDFGQDFPDWGSEKINSLLRKLVEFSKKSLTEWQAEKAGSGHVLEIYGSFPKKSNFKNPQFIPHQVLWGRFRVDKTTRIAGFTIPKEYDGREHSTTKHKFCSNTFYVVFLDANHDFYLTGK